jgi:uncharacterized protein (TIGR02594 family)
MIPAKYKYLEKEKGPKMLVEALKLVGTTEVAGAANNPTILAWAKEVGADVAKVYVADSIPWCGLAHAIVALRGGKEVVKDPLWALNWGNFGEYSPTPMLGDTLIFVRRTPDGKKAGHVALYVGEDDTTYHILGGNQGDTYGFTRIAKNRLYTARRPKYTTPPSNIRKIFLKPDGSISNNEQ